MRVQTHVLGIPTRGRGLHAVTRPVCAWLSELRPHEGLLTVFLRHTSASLLIQENADPEVLADLERFFARLVPDGDPAFRHTAEGPDDMPSHLRMVLTRTSEVVPVALGRMQLGTWQGIFLFEHRRDPHRRKISLTVMGD